jgi:hypothetical protein
MPRRALLALLLPALVACGGDEGPSRADYQQRANAICATAQQRTAALVDELSEQARSLSASTAPEMARTARRLQTEAERYVAQLRALQRPSDDAEEIEAFLEPAGNLVDAIGQAADALAQRNMVQALGVVQSSQAYAKDAQQAAAGYGLEQCRAFAALAPS